MTTTRINHTDHNHPNTTAARTACRKAMSTADVIISAGIINSAPIIAVSEPRNIISRRGGVVHAPNAHVDTPFPLCRTGGQSGRGTRYNTTTAPVSCRNCR